MGKKLHIGNLAHTVSSSDLQAWFTPFGTVLSANVIQDRDMGRSKGFGFVEMDYRCPGRGCHSGAQRPRARGTAAHGERSQASSSPDHRVRWRVAPVLIVRYLRSVVGELGTG